MSMQHPGLLRFQPILRRFLWGGRRLETVLGKPLGEGQDYAESWEVVDHGAYQSIVADGPWHGRPLHELVIDYGDALLGRHAGLPQFPLLLKFLDAHQRLSVQVHPNDAQAACLQPPDRGKTEAWIVLHADPGSGLFAGLKTGVDREQFERALRAGNIEHCLHWLQPQAGDCVFVPAGTVHALGEGLVVAEIQQSSDTTFRLFDWNRLGPDGRPRPLHIEEGLAVIDFERGPIRLQSPEATDHPDRMQLVRCDHFVVDRWNLHGAVRLGGDQRFHLLAVVDGRLRVDGDPAAQPLGKGQTALLPAAPCAVEAVPLPRATLLDMYLP